MSKQSKASTWQPGIIVAQPYYCSWCNPFTARLAVVQVTKNHIVGFACAFHAKGLPSKPLKIRDRKGELHLMAICGLDVECPLCNERLKLRSMPGLGEKHWHCPKCKTEWEVADLVEAVEFNEIEKKGG